jgi:hypothetical protein
MGSMTQEEVGTSLFEVTKEKDARIAELKTQLIATDNELRKCRHELALDAVNITKLKAKIEMYQKWIDDLQSGMYVNCVYCGHRYGPSPETPTSMADVLKAHVETCPEHPMAKLRLSITNIVQDIPLSYPGTSAVNAICEIRKLLNL